MLRGDGLMRVCIGERGELLFDEEQAAPEEVVEYIRKE
jgi:hypothetical protein